MRLKSDYLSNILNKNNYFFVVLHFKNTFFFLLLDFTFSLSDWYWFRLISRFFDKLDCETKLLLLLLLLLEVAELAVLLLTGVLLLLLFVLDGKDGIEVLILLNPIKLVVPYFLRPIKGVVEVKIWCCCCCCCSSWSVAGNKTDIGVGIGNGILFDADDCGGLKKLLFHINNLEKKNSILYE